MEKKTIDGIEYDVYTMEDWQRDREIKVQVGQLISPEVFWDLCGSVPPHKWSGGVFQTGEAHSYDFEQHCQVYMTFRTMGDHYYKYVGLKP